MWPHRVDKIRTNSAFSGKVCKTSGKVRKNNFKFEKSNWVKGRRKKKNGHYLRIIIFYYSICVFTINSNIPDMRAVCGCSYYSFFLGTWISTICFLYLFFNLRYFICFVFSLCINLVRNIQNLTFSRTFKIMIFFGIRSTIPHFSVWLPQIWLFTKVFAIENCMPYFIINVMFSELHVCSQIWYMTIKSLWILQNYIHRQ